ncbi:MAG: CHAD domain-containing protein [Leptolyngbyaceae cyanobacterium SM2_3_12]|nr:CHAD domain-containing protein [Leptolyngbyaceae cyanobacterium SM2_3_12]
MAIKPSTQTLGQLAQGAIAKYLKQVVASEQPVLADTDPENLHQMRVGLRRLRTAIQVFAVGVKLPKAGCEPRVAALGRQLGKLRDLDVIAATLRDRYAPDLPDEEQQRLGTVLLQLEKQRRRTFKQVKKQLKNKRYEGLAESLEAWVQAPEVTTLASLPAPTLVPDLILPLVSRLWLHPGWLVGTRLTPSGPKVDTRLDLAATDALISEQGPCLHSLRKQVKQVRYQLRLVAELYDNALEADIQRISAMQETLGDLQDSSVLEAFIIDQVPQAEPQMPTLFALLADRRHRAWKQWQTHQQYYLDPSHRQALRLCLAQPAGASAQDVAATSKTKSSGRNSRKASSAKGARERGSEGKFSSV